MKIHFIGIGGIGTSALAQFYLSEGNKVSGSDIAESKVTELLEKKGAKIFIGQKAQNISEDTGLVVYTLAVDKKNPEFEEAQRRKIKMLSYPEALGVISQGKFTIAVSGTHGKTTTTAMLAKIMIDQKLKPTVIAGSLMTEYKSNFVCGKDNYFLVEACEYRRSFLNLSPNVLVITNIDTDHLDYYKDLEDIQNAFIELARKLKPEDFLVCDINNKNLLPIISDKKVECNIIDYPSISTEEIVLKVPGKHNEANARASLTVATILELQNKLAIKSLKDFKGTWRRLESKGKTKKGVQIFDDYAHHPTEIKATLSSLNEMFRDKKVIAVFQPHLYSRTKLLLKEFGKCFSGVEEVLVAPIYAAREKKDSSISSKKVVSEIEKSKIKAKGFNDFDEISSYIAKNFDSSHIIVTMGAGDIYKLAEKIAK